MKQIEIKDLTEKQQQILETMSLQATMLYLKEKYGTENYISKINTNEFYDILQEYVKEIEYYLTNGY